MLDAIEMVSGHRVIPSSCTIGGVRRDIDKDMAKEIEKKLAAFKEILDTSVKRTITNDMTIRQRTVNKGILSKEQAEMAGAVGPTARGSGLALDIRQTGYGAYDQLSFEPIIETSGDCYARTMVRLRETYQAIDIVREALSKLPAGEVAVKVTENPQGETISRTEQPRGELFYYVKGNGTKNLERVKVRTPTFANIPALLTMLPGCALADVPILILSIDPCISCTER
jgi:ech hydrogenase subunit E